MKTEEEEAFEPPSRALKETPGAGDVLRDLRPDSRRHGLS